AHERWSLLTVASLGWKGLGVRVRRLLAGLPQRRRLRARDHRHAAEGRSRAGHDALADRRGPGAARDRGPVSLASHREADADARRSRGQENPHHRPGEGDHPEAADWADALLEHADATAEEGHHRDPDPDRLAR